MRPPAVAVGDVVVRELGPGSEQVVLDVFEGLSEEQRSRRFHAVVTRLTTGMLRHLANPDGWRHVALVAEMDGRPVGIARYHLTEAGRAEVAVEVVERHTRGGIARVLLEHLADLAARRGVTELHFWIQGENRPALGLAGGLAGPLEPRPGGLLLGRFRPDAGGGISQRAS